MDVIQFPSVRQLWKVSFADSKLNPTVRTFILIRGCDTIFDACTKAKAGETWKAFNAKFSDAEIVGCEFAGVTEN